MRSWRVKWAGMETAHCRTTDNLCQTFMRFLGGQYRMVLPRPPTSRALVPVPTAAAG
jgi:hypothetical protein